MSQHCFWILNNGTLVKPDSRHILAVVAAPQAFGETEESIRKTFARYGQHAHSNYEGKAREEILLRVIRRNHIRIRKNQYKRSQHWSLQLYALNDNQRASLSAWARYIADFSDDKYADVHIHQFKTGTSEQTSLDRLADAYNGDRLPAIISQAKLSEIFL